MIFLFHGQPAIHVLCFCGFLYLGTIKAAQTVWHVVRQPRAAEGIMCFEPPDGQSANVHVDPLEGEQQAGQAVVLKRGAVAEFAAVPQDTFAFRLQQIRP